MNVAIRSSSKERMAEPQLLDGIVVADFSMNVAGPFAGMILGDLGARVIKVEKPEGDDARYFAPRVNGESVAFMAFNRNKQSVILDLKSDAGRSAALALTTRSDVLIESLRPGTMDALGLGYEEVRKTNEGLVYCSVSAFGDSGIGRDLPGYDPIIQAFSGLMSMTGESGGPPVRVAAAVSDLTTGVWAALGIVAALFKRQNSGQGMRVGVSLFDSVMALLSHQVAISLATGEQPQKMGSASPLTAPYQAITSADGFVMVAAGNDKLFKQLLLALDLPLLGRDSRFQSVTARVENRAALIRELESRSGTFTSAALVQTLRASGIPCSPVNALAEALADPLVADRNVITTVRGHLLVPELRLVATPLRTGGGPLRTDHSAPPTLGQHSVEILDWLAAK